MTDNVIQFKVEKTRRTERLATEEYVGQMMLSFLQLPPKIALSFAKTIFNYLLTHCEGFETWIILTLENHNKNNNL